MYGVVVPWPERKDFVADDVLARVEELHRKFQLAYLNSKAHYMGIRSAKTKHYSTVQGFGKKLEKKNRVYSVQKPIKAHGKNFDDFGVIKERLIALGCNQKGLAAIVGIDEWRMSRILNGRVTPYNWELDRIAEALQIDISKWAYRNPYVRSVMSTKGFGADYMIL